MNAPGIEEYPLRTMEFYASCIGPSELNTVVAVTGGMKTFFLLNLANFAAIVGLPVCFVNLQMHPDEVRKRMIAMTQNVPLWGLEQHRAEISAASMEQARAIKFWDFSPPLKVSADALRQEILGAINHLPPPALILVDGLESLAEYDRAKTDALIVQLDGIATETGACIWMTAQGNRQSVGREIFDIPAIADTSSKAQISSQVIALGPRVDNELLTASWPKVRNGAGAFGSAVRLVVRPSVRLEVFETIGTSIRLGATPKSPLQPKFIGIDELHEPDEPATRDDDDEPGADEDDAAGAPSPLRPYHGKKGWVGVGRAVFGAPMFENQKAKYILWLVDLYQQAQFAKCTTLYAPKTKRPVKLARGQVMTTPRTLAKRWGVSRKQVETFLATAVREGLITVETEYRTHRTAQDFSDAKKPTMGPKEKAFCTVITLLHYKSKGEDDGKRAP